MFIVLRLRNTQSSEPRLNTTSSMKPSHDTLYWLRAPPPQCAPSLPFFSVLAFGSTQDNGTSAFPTSPLVPGWNGVFGSPLILCPEQCPVKLGIAFCLVDPGTQRKVVYTGDVAFTGGYMGFGRLQTQTHRDPWSRAQSGDPGRSGWIS